MRPATSKAQKRNVKRAGDAKRVHKRMTTPPRKPRRPNARAEALPRKERDEMIRIAEFLCALRDARGPGSYPIDQIHKRALDVVPNMSDGTVSRALSVKYMSSEPGDIGRFVLKGILHGLDSTLADLEAALADTSRDLKAIARERALVNMLTQLEEDDQTLVIELASLLLRRRRARSLRAPTQSDAINALDAALDAESADE